MFLGLARLARRSAQTGLIVVLVLARVTWAEAPPPALDAPNSLPAPAAAATPEDPSVSAQDIVRSAWTHWRGLNSYGRLTMTIHRASWERSISMRAWTKGQKQSLVRVTAPKKDVGNATLMLDKEMWTFSPKVNRVIKVPSSMLGQNWMGSDFSNKDVSRADDIVDEYVHTLERHEEHDGRVVYVIESIPHEDAAVVWGKEVLRVRDDDVLIAHDFYDQDGELVKSMRTLKIEELGGRTLATVMRMARVDRPEEWTEVRTDSMEFDVELPDRLFTLSNLRHPRD